MGCRDLLCRPRVQHVRHIQRPLDRGVNARRRSVFGERGFRRRSQDRDYRGQTLKRLWRALNSGRLRNCPSGSVGNRHRHSCAGRLRRRRQDRSSRLSSCLWHLVHPGNRPLITQVPIGTSGYRLGRSNSRRLRWRRQGDLAVYRPALGVWFILKSSTNYTGGVWFQWGISSDRVVPSDYDGDGITDLAVYRPSTGVWFILEVVHKLLIRAHPSSGACFGPSPGAKRLRRRRQG